jgi:hypothetical protein
MLLGLLACTPTYDPVPPPTARLFGDDTGVDTGASGGDCEGLEFAPERSVVLHTEQELAWFRARYYGAERLYLDAIPGVTHVTLDCLTEVQYLWVASMPQLEVLTVPEVTVTNSVQVIYSPAFQRLEMPVMQSTGQLTLMETPHADTVDAPVMTGVGRLQLTNTPALFEVAAPLTEVQEIVLGGNANPVVPPGITTLQNDLALIGSQLPDLDAFEPLTHVGRLRLEANPKLTDLSGLYGLQAVDGDVIIVANPQLTREQIDDLLAEIEFIGGVIEINDNGGA